MVGVDNTTVHFLQTLPKGEDLTRDVGQLDTARDSVSFLCYDIASLRKINHAYGRHVGDALLAAVANWVTEFTGGKLYRIEGDLFCLLFLDTDINCVYHYASSMDSRLGKMWQLETGDGHCEVYVQASIAVLGSLGRDYQDEMPELFERALEISRKNHQVIIFTAKHDKAAREQLRLQMELRACILKGMAGFELNYQPLADPTAGTWRGLEALCRWKGPTIGPMPPNIFIPEVEEMGLIHQLGSWVLNTALESCKAIGLDRLDNFFVSVNVSAIQLTKRNYIRTVLDALEAHQYPPHKLLLEITESTQFTFNETTLSAIEMLRAKGVLFALDDFGSGYSGFSNLKNLPADMLKTDRDFINNIENDTYLQYFYYIMSETAHANGMRLIAEGIETHDQLRSVVKNGADLIQGYLFGKPMSMQDIAANRAKFSQTLDEFVGWMNSLGDFKHWLSGQSAYQIAPSLFRLQSRCISLILDEDNLDSALDKIMETVGSYFKVNRVYIFLRDGDALYSNRHEWCAPGVESQMHLFQQVDGRLDGFYDVLNENEVVIATNETQLPANLKARLADGQQAESVQSMVVMPMKQRGEILGFVGFDDMADRDWMPEELIILHNLCLLCLIILAKKDCGGGNFLNGTNILNS